MDPHSLAGAACLVAISFLPVLAMYVRGEPLPLPACLGLVVVALHGVSFVNALGGTLPGAGLDASTFHKVAANLADSGAWPQVSMGTKFYEYILTGAYRLFGAHILVGQSLSVVAGAVSLLIINAAAVNLGVEDVRTRAGIILVSGLYPTFLYHSALTFREPYELLGLVAGMFFALGAFRELRWRWVAGMVLSFLFMGLFHHVLLGICVLLICLYVVLFYITKRANTRNYLTAMALVALTAGIGYVAITNIPITLENNYIKEVRQQNGIVGAIVEYREAIESRNPRTSYGSSIDAPTEAGVAVNAVINYWNYLSRPLVSDLEWLADGVPFLSSVGRLLLLAGVLWLLLARDAGSRELVFCLGAYVLVTAVWSLGTTNYGQAFRHHALTDWLAVLMFAAAWCRARTRSAASDGLELRQ